MGVYMEKKGISINQIGYLPEQTKMAFFKTEEVGKAFSIINVENNQIAYIGKIMGSKYSETADEEIAIGDFSKLTEVGCYEIMNSKRERSYSFRIGEGIYNNVFKDSIKFFYLQRCGEEIKEEYGGKWAHPACHTSLATIYGSTQKVDVSGGWHDAGDYGRYILATAKAVADLLLAYEANPDAFQIDLNVPRKDKEIPYFLEEIKGQLIWMLKMQEPISGGVYHKVTCAHFPGHETMPQEEVNELIVCPISTMATATFAAVMAIAYEIYNKVECNFAEKCLGAARKAWEYLEETPERGFRNPQGITTGEYGGDTDLDERYWAAAQLFKATGEERYAQVAEKYAIQGEINLADVEQLKKEGREEFNNERRLSFTYGWKGTGAYGDKAYLHALTGDKTVKNLIKKRIIKRAEQIMAAARADGYRIYAAEEIYIWGSNMQMLMLALYLRDAYEVENKPEYLAQASRYVDYCLGANPLNISYVTGYGSEYARYPHHRPSMAQKETIPGMLVGGPNVSLVDSIAQERLQEVPAARCYVDHYESFGTNEVDIYWNSTWVCALARLNLV